MKNEGISRVEVEQLFIKHLKEKVDQEDRPARRRL
jgi:hypothetical protein